MTERKENFCGTETEVDCSLERSLLRQYYRKHKPYYLTCISESHRLEAIRKTISETEVVFLSTDADDPCFSTIDDADPRENDLKNHFPSLANKFINYRKEQDERKRNEVPAGKTVFFWQRRKNN